MHHPRHRGPTSANVILAEIGPDMSRFRTVGHLVSWAGLCPEMHESAGKRRSTRVRKGDPWLKAMLVPCAWPAIAVKDSYLRARFLRLKARRGVKKAIVAMAADLLQTVSFILTRNTPLPGSGRWLLHDNPLHNAVIALREVLRQHQNAHIVEHSAHEGLGLIDPR